MRTTVNLPASLLEAAKRRAQSESRTFTSVLEEALRRFLQTPEAPVADVELPTYGSRGGRVLVDLDDRDAVWDALDQP